MTAIASPAPDRLPCPGLLTRRSASPVDDDEVEAQGGYYEHGLSASCNIYRLRRDKERWRVISDRVWLIS